MLQRFYPDEYLDSTYVIDFDKLYEEGYRGIIFDIDNTLVPHGAPADERAKALFARLKAIGFRCCLISNNQKPRVEMFNKDFAENDIWQHFDAVKNGRVYDLTYEYFGMSATFKYPQALEELQPILYPESDEDTAKAKEASDNAQKKAKDSDATEKYNEQQSK